MRFPVLRLRSFRSIGRLLWLRLGWRFPFLGHSKRSGYEPGISYVRGIRVLLLEQAVASDSYSESSYERLTTMVVGGVVGVDFLAGPLCNLYHNSHDETGQGTRYAICKVLEEKNVVATTNV